MKKTNENNNNLISIFKAAVTNGRLCHAYILLGENGIGKFSFAKEMAKIILCKNNNKPCNECESCKKIDSEIHPDVIMYRDNGSPNGMSVEDARLLRQSAYVAPNESETKIYIIESADKMTHFTPNVLLKIIEEPPKNVIFILTASNDKAVYKTIMSRCVPIKLLPMSDEYLRKALIDEFPDKASNEIDAVISVSNGIFGVAKKMLCDEKNMLMIEKVFDATQ